MLSSDPYALCGKETFANPCAEGHPKHEKYADRQVLMPYDGSTEWLALVGYALPREQMTQVDDVISLGEVCKGTSLLLKELPGDAALLVRGP